MHYRFWSNRSLFGLASVRNVEQGMNYQPTRTPTELPPIRRFLDTDRALLVEMMVRAFDDDPLANWMILQDRRRSWRFRRYFEAELERSHKQGIVEVCGFGIGAAFFTPPGASRMGFKLSLRTQWGMMQAIGPARHDRMNRCLRPAFDSDPASPHWGLSAIGVEPVRQGQGIGSLLLGRVLAECDRTETSASLLCTKAKNVAFYERHGYKVIREHDIPDRGPRVWRMWRDPDTVRRG
jgi:ribosomal protein S18 acetylase RimI-like enzyme